MRSAMYRYILVFMLYGVVLNAQSPYTLNWKKECAILGVGLGSFAYGEATNANIIPLTVSQIETLDRNTIHPIDRSAVNHYELWAADMSNIGVLTLMASPSILFADKKIQKDWMTISVMYGEMIGLGATIPNWTKNSVQRIRPYVYNPNVPMDTKMERDAQRSFFSGHTCLAFSSAVFFSSVYSDYYPHSKWRPYIWTLSLLSAGTVGYMRYQSGNHFPTDILIGAAVGSGIGYIIPRIHRNNSKKHLGILPSIGDNSLSITAIYRW